MIVLVISHVHLLREALAAALHGTEDSEAFGASSHETVEAITLEFPPGLIVVDVSHPEGMMLVASVRAFLPQVKVMVLATRERDEDFFAWVEIGISGYLGPDTSAREILAAVRCTEAGEVVCSPRLTALMLRRLTGGSEVRVARGGIHELTPREIEVAKLLAQGMSNKLIAHELRIAMATAKNHVHSVLDKWDVCSRGEAAAYYRDHVQKNVEPIGSSLAELRESHRPHPGASAAQNSGARTSMSPTTSVTPSTSPARAISSVRISPDRATSASPTRSSQISLQKAGR